MFGAPEPCPSCQRPMDRRGGKDWCPDCYYVQPCCDGGQCL